MYEQIQLEEVNNNKKIPQQQSEVLLFACRQLSAMIATETIAKNTNYEHFLDTESDRTCENDKKREIDIDID